MIDEKLFANLPDEEVHREQEYQATFATIPIETKMEHLFDKVTIVERKIERAEKMARDVQLILAGVCLGLYIAIILSRL